MLVITLCPPYSAWGINTYFIVNEEVADAIGTTAVGMGLISPLSPPVVKVNHPFIYGIAEQPSGIIFFIVMVNNLPEN